jgi:type VI secretion system protein
VTRRAARLWLGPALMAALGGCAVPAALCFVPDTVRTVDLRATADANGDRPVAVDLVFARDEAAAAALASLSARDYFASRAQLQADFPGRLIVSSWELVPGQHLDGAATGARCGVKATYLFADFASPGAHRLRLAESGRVTVLLGRDGAGLES